MTEDSRVITDEDEIYVFFEMIKRLEPKSILDFGMFLKRIGTISRQAMSCEIPADIRLDAVDLFPDVIFPVYRRVYSRIESLDQWRGKEAYDLVSFFSVNDHLKPEEKKRIWKCLPRIAGCVLADTRDSQFVQFLIDHFRADAVTVDGKTYAVAYRRENK